jgi:gluconokinase
MQKAPRSPKDEVGGMTYFPRMLDKIRLFAAGELRPDFHANLGRFGDGWCTAFLRVEYDALRERVLAGGSDEEILEWCFVTGRKLNPTDLLIWNAFVAKLGWRDAGAPRLAKLKAESGLADRDDIQTMVEFMEVDEGRMS